MKRKIRLKCLLLLSSLFVILSQPHLNLHADNAATFEFGASTTSPAANISTISVSQKIIPPQPAINTPPEPTPPSDDAFIAADDTKSTNANENTEKTVLINFNNVSIIEYIRFVSRISNRNFVFDENDLQFNVTIISEEPATIDNIMTALLQELLIHELVLIEEGNNLIIHKNPKVNGISKVVSEDFTGSKVEDSDIVTQVFRLNTLDPERAAVILRPLTSENALIEALKDSNHLIVTDISANVAKIAQLIKSLDAPNSGLVIGQYVSQLTAIDVLIPLVQQIMQPISQDQTLTFVSQPTTNSIFIIASPFLVERTIAILQYLDQDHGTTRIFNLKDLKLGNVTTTPSGTIIGPNAASAAQGAASVKKTGTENVIQTNNGEWILGPDGKWIFKPATPTNGDNPPTGRWIRDADGKWTFIPGEAAAPGSEEPKGHWVKDKDGNWVFQLDEGEPFINTALSRQFPKGALLPGGVEKKTQFYIYKLKYRKGDSVEPSLRQIADTILQNERGNEDLISALRSVQWITPTNSLVFSGTQEALDKVSVLVGELDAPMRQVFIEMLIMETSLDDSLEYGVSYITDFGGDNAAGAQSFFTDPNTPLINVMKKTTGVTGLGLPESSTPLISPIVPDARNLIQNTGLNLGIIGQKITHCGTEFGSIGALVHALHDRTKDEVISNPKILVEDGSPAEIFVGLNTPYRTQSISNDLGSVITSNYEYRDIGTRLKVTPYLGNGNIIALDIEEEVSTIVAGLITNASTASTSPGPTTRIHRTTTRAHIPDTYFLIISGMMQDEESRERNQVPCLGSVPLIGAAFSDKHNTSAKRNLMIFIRPQIIDTEEEVQWLTKHQQDIYDYHNCLQNSDEYETTEALDLFNVKATLHPEDDQDCDSDKMGLHP